LLHAAENSHRYREIVLVELRQQARQQVGLRGFAMYQPLFFKYKKY
jgi:hypothetical protein